MPFLCCPPHACPPVPRQVAFSGAEQPKLFPRPNGDVHVCGFADQVERPPPLTDKVRVRHSWGSECACMGAGVFVA
jgi:hypothetical protein